MFKELTEDDKDYCCEEEMSKADVHINAVLNSISDYAKKYPEILNYYPEDEGKTFPENKK